jgi:hypothetical protein
MRQLRSPRLSDQLNRTGYDASTAASAQTWGEAGREAERERADALRDRLAAAEAAAEEARAAAEQARDRAEAAGRAEVARQGRGRPARLRAA